jgi:hypothetical protein
MFQKGQSGNPGGKKPGTLNKATRDTLNLRLWFGMVIDDLKEIAEAEKRIPIEMEIINKLLNKTANLPRTPEESVENVDQMIEAYEAQKGNDPVNG